MTRTVLFCGAWDDGSGYPRTRSLQQGLRAQGANVVECRLPAMGQGKQRLLRQPWWLPFWALGEVLQRFRLRRAVRAAVAQHAPDFVVVPYPGHHLVAMVRRCVSVPVVLDLFLPAYDTAVVDRQLFAADSLMAKALRHLDRSACRAADLVLLDTEVHAAHVAQQTGVPSERFDWLPVGDPEAPAQCAAYPRPTAGRLQVLFFGTGVPLHGLRTLVDAVARAPSVSLVLVGGADEDREHAQAQLGARVQLHPTFVPRAELQSLMDAAPLVAGVFGTSPKTDLVVPFKVMHALASGRPVITADTAAVRPVLGDSPAGFLVPAGDVDALATRLEALAHAPAQLAAAAAAARAVYDQHFAVTRTGARFATMLNRLVAAHGAKS
jgi:glycosyltransferase involved in cell wall biosynthesis